MPQVMLAAAVIAWWLKTKQARATITRDLPLLRGLRDQSRAVQQNATHLAASSSALHHEHVRLLVG